MYRVQQGFTLETGLLADIRFIEHDRHFRIEIFERSDGPKAELITGQENKLIERLKPQLDCAVQVDAALSFVMKSGLKLVEPYLQDMLTRGGRLRLLAGDYMDVTEPRALRELLDLQGDVDLRVFEAAKQPFHPKSWIFNLQSGEGALIVGSSNLSRTALTSGVEWNLRLNPGQKLLRAATTAFESLFYSDNTSPLSNEWIDTYEARRRQPEQNSTRQIIEENEPAAEPPTPHNVQQEALKALNVSRACGETAGLVVLATGLGKTYLAAFDSLPFERVLFVAHREEILTQAMQAFRDLRPGARMGRFVGGDQDYDADILFASVQSMARVQNLSRFASNAFDYVVIDEFHHASAPTYQRLIDYFRPDWLLGLTATPDRTDGANLLSLCNENLVFNCDLWEGINRDLLCPFKYYGVPDLVEYAQIPWRNGKFDADDLTKALATQERAQNALEQFQKFGQTKALGFCASRRHADYMADFFKAQGLRAVSVHSGPTSAPRTSSLEKLQAGKLDIVFSVDMFNEGVDVPQIDTVLMLRPTESPIVWLQQLGRGLRRASDKAHLSVIDYIGNHRSFLTKARTLFAVGAGDRALSEAFAAYDAGQWAWPKGCEVTYELETIDLLKSLLRIPRESEQLAAFYRDFLDRWGQRPTASETAHARFNPSKNGQGTWFDFVNSMGGLDSQQKHVLAATGAFLRVVERTAMTKSYKMLVLRALLQLDGFGRSVELRDLLVQFGTLLKQNPRFAADVGIGPKNDLAVRRALMRYPLPAWTDLEDGRWFERDNSKLTSRLSLSGKHRTTFNKMLRELVDWRLSNYLDREVVEQPKMEVAEPQHEFRHSILTVGTEYMRQEIPKFFGAEFNTGSWQQGIVRVNDKLILLVTLNKQSMSQGAEYKDRFESPEVFHWQSQNSTRKESRNGKMISGEVDSELHLFVRDSKLRAGKAAPFHYCGQVSFQSWQGEKPISVVFRLKDPLSGEYARKVLVEEDRN
ncbi:restriction endonuclease subunit R [Rhodobacteraceae bacterium 4F10]|nr:restriction endonuclease subunit R [Rhodobacteraceae bacterium 4F10]